MIVLKWLGIVAASFLALIAGAIIWFILSFPTYTYRYRMTVEVEADGHVHTGSSVIEVHLTKQPRFLIPVPPVVATLSGEAPFVDFGDGRHVIATLSSDRGNGDDFAKHVVPANFRLSYENEDLVKYPHLQGRWELDRGTLPSSRLPTFVTFTNIDDPKSARVVKPEEFGDAFGPGVKPPTISIEMTKEPITHGIENRLSWLPHPKYLSGRFACGQTEPHCLHGGHFRRN